MAQELDTVEIHSLKDPKVKWIINAEDFEPGKHELWVEGGGVEEVKEEEVEKVGPADEDYVRNRSGEVIAIHVVNPTDRRARMQIKPDEFDPAEYTPWSQHRG